MIKTENLHRAAFVAFTLALFPIPDAKADQSPFTVKPPSVSGPIPSTAKNFAFLQDGFGPAPRVPAGYREREYFVSGRANIYEYTPTGIRIVAPCPASVTGTATPACTDLKYTTRMIVMMPSNPRRFSGNVVVEPLNPTANLDGHPIWALSSNYLTRSGDIFIGWTSKSVTVDALKRWNSKRYAALDWPHKPLSSYGNDAPYDGITFDIASQIGALVKRGGAGGPLQGYRVKNVIEAGYSQDARFTFTQANVFSRLARLPGGNRIYDGYLPVAYVPDSVGLNYASINFGLTPAGWLAAGDRRRKMRAHDGPVIQVNTQTELSSELFGPGGIRWRRPDSDAANDRYRAWEVPGSSHDALAGDAMGNIGAIEFFGTPYVLGVRRRDLRAIGSGQLGANGSLKARLNPALAPCDRRDVNPFPFVFVQNAALQAVIEWITKGKPAPHAARLKVRNLSTNAEPLLDRHGNALGGVRTPYTDVPDRAYVAFGSGPATCSLEGHSNPFSRKVLHKLYGSRDGYVNKFASAAAATVKRGFWLPRDAGYAISQARQVRMPWLRPPRP
jgi:hypothetical protein